MNILICIDDTDNEESIGTGHLAAFMSDALEKNGWGTCSPITRHQLLVHPDIPYTSHNSSMCFPAEIESRRLETVTEFLQSFLKRESAPGSDPGLCIVDTGALSEPEALIGFGKRAKAEILRKEDAYRLSERLSVHLSEHGGAGIGVIGALAGCGLRISGNDGRFRGHFPVTADNGCLKAAELRTQTGVDCIRGLDGTAIDDGEVVLIGEKVKAIYQENSAILPVYRFKDPEAGTTEWKTCSKEQLKVF